MARRVRLTKSFADALKPGAKEYLVYDTEVPALACRVRSSGGKHYVIAFGRVEGRKRWGTIGEHGNPWTVDEARAEALRQLGQGAQVQALRKTGTATTVRHPVEARELRKSIPTLAEFAERYLSEYAEAHKGAGSVLADKGLLGLLRDDRKPGERSILGWKDGSEVLGDVRLDRIDTPMLSRLHAKWRDTPTRANRALALLSHMFGRAEAWGLRPQWTNPCKGIKRYPETKRERFLSAEELRRLGAALDAAEKEERLSPYGLAAIRVLVFTGARASEVLGLQAEEIKTGTVRMVRKGRRGTLHLPEEALAVMRKLPNPPAGNPYVFLGGKIGTALTLSGLEQIWQEVRNAAKLDSDDPAKQVRLHDLRHTNASVGIARGRTLPEIGAQLGHTRPETTARYAHVADAHTKGVAADASRAVAAMMSPKKKAAKKAGEVVPIRARRRARG
jgi:integrase